MTSCVFHGCLFFKIFFVLLCFLCLLPSALLLLSPARERVLHRRRQRHTSTSTTAPSHAPRHYFLLFLSSSLTRGIPMQAMGGPGPAPNYAPHPAGTVSIRTPQPSLCVYQSRRRRRRRLRLDSSSVFACLFSLQTSASTPHV